MDTKTRIAQSRVRVKSGIRLVGFLVAVSVTSLLLEVAWLAKLAAAGALFFGLVTFLEFWNVKRLTSRS